MKRRFFNVDIDEPSKEETKNILYNCKHKYETFHNVKYSKSIIDCVVDFSDSLISNKKFPDKAFDIIDQVGSRVKIKNLEPCSKIVDSHKNLAKFLAQEDSDVEEIKTRFQEFLNELEEAHKKATLNKIKIKKEDNVFFFSTVYLTI